MDSKSGLMFGELSESIGQDFYMQNQLMQNYIKQMVNQYEQNLMRIMKAEMLMSYGYRLITAMMSNELGMASFDMSKIAMDFSVLQKNVQEHTVAEMTGLKQDMDAAMKKIAPEQKKEVDSKDEKAKKTPKPKTVKPKAEKKVDAPATIISEEKAKETVDDRYNNAQNEYYRLRSSRGALEQRGLTDSDQYREIMDKIELVRKEVDTLMEVRANSRRLQSNYYGDKSKDMIAQESVEDRMSRITRESGDKKLYMDHLEDLELAGSGKYVSVQSQIDDLNAEYGLLQRAESEREAVVEHEVSWKRTETPKRSISATKTVGNISTSVQLKKEEPDFDKIKDELLAQKAAAPWKESEPVQPDKNVSSDGPDFDKVKDELLAQKGAAPWKGSEPVQPESKNNLYSLADFKEKKLMEQSRQDAMITQASINAATMATLSSSQNVPSMEVESVAMGRR